MEFVARKIVMESGPGPRCVCGKSTFRSLVHARAHARNAHSERMRIYRCPKAEDVYHLTNNEKNQKLPSMDRPTRTKRRVDTRKARYKSKRLLARYLPEDPVAEPGTSA